MPSPQDQSKIDRRIKRMNLSLSFVKHALVVKSKDFKRFNDWSKKYDKSILQFLVFRNSHDMFIRNLLQDNRPFRILDVGCGTGEFALKLKGNKKDANIYGVDISTDMIKVAKGKTKFNKDMDFRVGDVEDMPYDNNYFDYITCAHSFHHYPNKRKAIREMYRVLKDNGKVMIIDGYKDRLLGKFIFDFIIKKHEVNVHHLHSKQFQRIMKRIGFKDIAQTIFNPLIPLLLTRGVADKKSS
jgi:ubiquinone/menaquinone biosynthesis C-methylase UbiE